jgi:eukaryotic-like serine/threonine-protein kinase
VRDDRWRAVEPHLDRILDLADSDRAAELSRLRASDPDLAAELARLLALGEDVDRERFLEDAPAAPPRAASLAGQTVGAYTLIEPLGQGGMGSVWLARRSDGRFEGRAAVKLLNASLVGRAGEERFRREGSILARLADPHIARLLDAGVSDWGQPYLVLEHVDGNPIDVFCDAKRLGIEARLRLFLDMADAVSQAHASLVVHRDIKPSNVLVDRDGRVKLLDFGIAKLLEDDGAGLETALTREGGRAFTPEFAAPEQLTGSAVTTATDVHALGTLLYLLIAGHHPAGSARSSPAELLKAIVETDPARPSEAANEAEAAARSTTREGLRRQLRGDLDTIVTKALKKNPAERYVSVDAMASDVRRYLANEPIAARPDTFGYRAAKFVRRHRAGVALGALVAIAALAGTAAIVWQAEEARKQRDAAQAQLARATASSEFLGFLLSAAAPAGKKFVVTDLLDEGERVIEKQFRPDDPLRAELLADIGKLHLTAQRLEKAQPVLERAEKAASGSDDPALRARARCPLALAWIVSGKKDRGEALVSQALGDLPPDPQYALARAECQTRWADFGYYTDEGEPMVRHASEALASLAEAPVPATVLRLDAQAALAYGYYLTRQNEKADAAYVVLTRELEETGRDRTLTAADAWNNWALMYHRGDIRRAEGFYRRSLELHRSIAGEEGVPPVSLHNYAGVLLQLARDREAEPFFREAIRAARAQQIPYIELFATMELAGMYAETGRLAEARTTLATLDSYLGTKAFTPLRRAFLAQARGMIAWAAKDPREARARFTEAVGLYDGIPAKFTHGVLALVALARAELAQGQRAAAEAAARKALALSESFVDKDAPSYLVGLSLAVLGEIELATGRTEAGRATMEKAVAHLQTTLGAEHPATLEARRALS